MSLRWKVAIAMSAMAFVITTVFGVASYRSTRLTQMNAVDRSLEDMVAPGPGGGRDGRDGRGDRDRDSPRYVQYIDSDGEVLETTFDEPVPVDGRALRVVQSGRGSVFTTVPTSEGEFRALTVTRPDSDVALQVFRPLTETNQVLGRVRLLTALLALSISGLAALLGWWFAGRLTAPLRRLTLASEHVAATGELDVEVAAETGDEVGRLANGFNSMLAALRRSRADQQRLVQDAGHELRTPLTSLRTNVSLLHRYPGLDAAARDQILADLQSETDELTVLVNEIVAIASGELDDEDAASVDLREVADDVAARFERRTERAVAVTGVDAASIQGRPRAINRAISCLVENACKFDRSDGPIDIEVGPRSVRVLDRGPGLSEVDAELLFDRFYRAESSRALPGSGLGLSIVKQVADRHGGTATAREREGGGAVFEIGFAGTESQPDPEGQGRSGTAPATSDPATSDPATSDPATSDPAHGPRST